MRKISVLRTVYGRGYSSANTYTKRDNPKRYHTWHAMMQRCYSEYSKNKQPTYRKCRVCREWHDFQNFAKWYEENYYEVDGERMNLDKDILVKGNKIYSPNTCIFVTQRINTLFVKSDKKRGKYPIGVTYDKCHNKYKSHHCGYYDTAEEAFEAYKEYKENYIKQIANEYKDKIPNKLYKAMYDYKVELSD